MKNKSLAFIPKLLCALLLAPLCAMAISDTEKIASEGQALPTDPDWPKEIVELLEDPLRTDGWISRFSDWPNDVYHYGMRVRNAEDINHLIAKLAAINVTNAQVCLRPEKEVGALGFTTEIEKGNGLAATFSFGNQKRINQWFEHLPEIEPGVKKFGVHRLTKPPEALPPTLTLYVGHAAVDLKKLRIPKQIKVISEIPDFYRKKQPVDPAIKTIDEFVKSHFSSGTLVNDERFSIPDLTTQQRVDLVTEAHQAFRQLVQKQNLQSTNIPPEFWGPSIKNLKPLRVLNDRVNIKIVLMERDGIEGGFYVNLSISSFHPEDKSFLEFVKLSEPDEASFGILYRYKLARPPAVETKPYATL